IDRRLEPPFLDDDPARPWANTRQKTFLMMQERDYTAKAPTRRLTDIMTFVSFAEVRQQRLDEREVDVMSSILGELEQTEPTLVREIHALRARLLALGAKPTQG